MKLKWRDYSVSQQWPTEKVVVESVTWLRMKRGCRVRRLRLPPTGPRSSVIHRNTMQASIASTPDAVSIMASNVEVRAAEMSTHPYVRGQGSLSSRTLFAFISPGPNAVWQGARLEVSMT